LKNASVSTSKTQDNKTHENIHTDIDEKLTKLKKKLLQEKKKNEKLLQENDQMKILHDEQVDRY